MAATARILCLSAGTIWLQLLLLLTIWCSSSTANGIFPRIVESDVICNEGQWVEFTCEGATVWMLNNRPLPSVPDGTYTTSREIDRSRLKIHCLAVYNTSLLNCFNVDLRRSSNNVSLLVQGGLGPVLDLYFWQRSRSLSWTPPFQLNTSERIVYSITVVKVTEGLHGFEEFPNHTDTFLKLDGKVEVGHHYNASVVPVNAVGRGEATSLSFHMEERDLRATGTDAANTEDVQSSPLTLGKSKLSTGMTTLVVGGLVLLVIVMILVALVVVSLAVYLCRVKHNKMGRRGSLRTLNNSFVSQGEPGGGGDAGMHEVALAQEETGDDGNNSGKRGPLHGEKVEKDTIRKRVHK